MTFIQIVSIYQSRNQRSLLRKEIDYLIEKYKRKKDAKKVKLEVEKLKKLRKVFKVMIICWLSEPIRGR